jgi:hypothetical protein
VLGGFIGALPVLIGAYGNFILRDRWALSIGAQPPVHSDLWLCTCLLIPSRRWVMEERFWMEISLWPANSLFICWMLWCADKRQSGV